MKEQMREEFEVAITSSLKEAGCSQLFIENVLRKDGGENYLMNGTQQGLSDFCLGYQAALSAVPENHIPEVGEMVPPITDTDSAREFLVGNLLPKFSDSTFSVYVRSALAGDFAYQLAKYLQAQQVMRKAKQMSEADRELLKNEFYFANDGKERDWSEQEAQAQQPAQEPVKQESWISVDDRLPEVEPEDYELAIVSVYSAATGKTYVFEAAYLNQVEVMSEDCDYTSFTGWHTRLEHPDYDGWYEPISGNGDDRIVTHWMPLPLPPVKEVTE